MSIEWFLFLVELITNITHVVYFLIGVLLVGVVFAIIMLVFGVNEELSDNASHAIAMYMKKVFKCTLVLVLVALMLPSSSMLYTIGGLHYTKQPELSTNNPVTAKAQKVLELKLDEILAEETERTNKVNQTNQTNQTSK